MSPAGRPRTPTRLGPGFIAALVLLVAFVCICLIGLFAEFGGSNWGTNIIIVGVVLAGLIALGNVFYGRSSPYVKAHARSAPPPMPPRTPPRSQQPQPTQQAAPPPEPTAPEPPQHP